MNYYRHLSFPILTCLILTCSLSGCDQKSSERIPVADFFGYAERSNFRISPEGQYVSYLSVGDQDKRHIYLLNVDEEDPVPELVSDTSMHVQGYYWVNESTLVYTSQVGVEKHVQIFRIDLNDRDIQAVAQPAASRIRFISSGQGQSNELLVSMNERDSSVFDIYRLDVQRGTKRLIAKNPGNIIRWYADLDGKLRLALASDSVQETMLYRETERDHFRVVTSNSFHNSVVPLGFVKDEPHHIFALSNVDRDKRALVQLNLKNNTEVQELYSHAEVDVSSGGYSRSSGEMSYAYYFTWKRDRYFLKDSVRMLYEKLEELLPGYDMCLLEEVPTRRRMLLNAFTDRNPGVIYYFDGETGRLLKLSETNPRLKENEMAVMRPVSFFTRDSIRIHGYLTLPNGGQRQNLPVIVIPHGGPGERDVWGFNTEVQFFANRGYAVFQLNFRGSSGYGKEFWMAGFKEWGGKIQDDIEDGVRWLIAEKIADADRIGIYGSDFGGYSAMYGASFNSDLFACAASYGGFTNLFTLLKEVPPHLKPYLQMYYEFIGNPETESDRIRSMSPVFHSEKIGIPVLVAIGGRDSRNSVPESNQFIRSLKKRKIPTVYIVQENEGRYFRKEENLIQFYEELGEFFDAYLKK